MAAFADGSVQSISAFLSDGAPVLIRPVMKEDWKRLVAGMEQLSSTSRYYRFLTPQRALSPEELRYFTEVDQQSHVAWVAVDPTLPTQPGMGIGRFVRPKRNPSAAEFALTVIDANQRKGVGRLLLAVLYALAHAGRVRNLEGIVLSANKPVVQWLLRLGARLAWSDGVWQVTLPVARVPRVQRGNVSAERFREAVEYVRQVLSGPAAHATADWDGKIGRCP